MNSLLSFYHSYISPLTHALLAPLVGSSQSCRFTPTCSQYTKVAFQKYSPLKATYLSLNRLLRCHPFSQGGFDPVK